MTNNITATGQLRYRRLQGTTIIKVDRIFYSSTQLHKHGFSNHTHYFNIMSNPGSQRAGDAIRDTTPLPSITNTSENTTPLTDGATLNLPGGSTSTTANNFDIVEAARTFFI